MWLLAWFVLWIGITGIACYGVGHAVGWRDARRELLGTDDDHDERSAESLRALERIHLTRPIRS